MVKWLNLEVTQIKGVEVRFLANYNPKIVKLKPNHIKSRQQNYFAAKSIHTISRLAL